MNYIKLPRFNIKNGHEFFKTFNPILKGPGYVRPGTVIKLAAKELIDMPIGSGAAIDIEPDNPDSTMATFVKTGDREIEYIGTAK